MGKRLMSLVLGVAIIIGGIALYRYAGNSQNRAANFAEAQRVTAEEVVEGYVAVEGTAVSNEAMPCPFDGGGCAYVRTEVQEYTAETGEECGALDNDTVIIEYTGEECTGTGETESCESCYIVETYEWSTTDTSTDSVALTLGSYSVSRPADADFDGTVSQEIYDLPESETDPYVGDIRTKLTYMPLQNIRLVSGIANANGDIADGGDDKPLRISAKTYESLASDLEKQDNTMKWALRVGGILLGLIGLAAIGSAFSLKKTLLGKTMSKAKDITNLG